VHVTYVVYADLRRIFILILEWHSVERIPPPRPLMSQNSYC